MAIKLFKIRKKGGEDLYSTGGNSPRWSKTGKTWSNIGHVKLHMQQYCQPTSPSRWGREYADYREAEIVTYEAVPTATKDAFTFLREVKDAQQVKVDALQRKAKEAQQRGEIQRLKELRKKYPDA